MATLLCDRRSLFQSLSQITSCPLQKLEGVAWPIVASHCVLRRLEGVAWQIGQSGAAANFGDHQICGPNVNKNIYILAHEYSSPGFEWRLNCFRDCQIWGTGSGNSAILAPKFNDQHDQENCEKTPCLKKSQGWRVGVGGASVGVRVGGGGGNQVKARVSTVIRTLQNGSVSALGRFNLSGTG